MCVCLQAGVGAASISEVSGQRGTAGARTAAGRQTDGADAPHAAQSKCTPEDLCKPAIVMLFVLNSGEKNLKHQICKMAQINVKEKCNGRVLKYSDTTKDVGLKKFPPAPSESARLV